MMTSQQTFQSLPANEPRTITWIHIGDPHMTKAGAKNEIDLGRIVDEINAIYTSGVDFVFVPGDIADDGSKAAYETFRSHMDRLRLPWCGIVGDHDVHEKSYDNFRKYIATDLYSTFTIGQCRFFRLNAFSVPKPDSFTVNQEQLAWLEEQLHGCSAEDVKPVLFLHCYPSDLKEGGPELSSIIHRYPVLLVDMGHTHYNELSNDGDVLYSATRSTGQIEEGPVGYSVISIDANTVSWHFVRLGTPCLVNITSPADERLSTSRTTRFDDPGPLPVRAKVWSRARLVEVSAIVQGRSFPLIYECGCTWSAKLDGMTEKVPEHTILVRATDEHGTVAESSIRISAGRTIKDRPSVDQQNAIGAWPERGILGTQLGPNKNGRKW